ncbi:hypothetical protein, partial [Sphingomonas sp. LH128]|uniref:hypothetical protein n=1 Tax=Sphingomonas sp. LH128 TaxID=473781 RepID=UPI000565D325
NQPSSNLEPVAHGRRSRDYVMFVRWSLSALGAHASMLVLVSRLVRARWVVALPSSDASE